MSPREPIGLASPSGLSVRMNANGSIRRIDHHDVIVNAFLGNEIEGGPANLFLRRRGARIEWTPLLGPAVPASSGWIPGLRGDRRVGGAALPGVAVPHLRH